METVLAIAVSGFLVSSLIVIVRLVRSGRALVHELELRHPHSYKALGCPLPGYFNSLRRTRYSQFVMRREYEDLPDPALVSRFEAQRKLELRFLTCALIVLALLGLLLFYLRYAA